MKKERKTMTWTKENKSEQDAFSAMHPFAMLTFFLVEMGVAVFLNNPLMQAVSLLTAMIYGTVLLGRGMLKNVVWCLMAMVFVAVLNPLFSHEGETILFYFRGGNPCTKESIYYGLGMAIMIGALLLWFRVFSAVMTTDKWVHLFGRVVPNLALLLTMMFRFFPKMKRQYQQMKMVHPQKNAYELFSMLVTFSLETSVDTADSMRARGYGVRQRTHYSLYHLRGRDIVVSIISVLMGSWYVWLLKTDKMYFLYYPTTELYGTKLCVYGATIMFFCYSLVPLCIDIWEVLKWNYLQSKI